MEKILSSLAEYGFDIHDGNVDFDGITFGRVSARDSNAIDCYPFVCMTDADNMWLDANNMIFESDPYYTYYEEFFDEYDYLFTVNKNGARMKLNSTCSDEVNILELMKKILDIYFQIKTDMYENAIDNF